MSTIKSYSVGNGDTFYINHNSDNFTIIDCCLDGAVGRSIVREIKELSQAKGVTRFISTHPDDDHFRGLERLDDSIGIRNFYCVKNSVTKEEDTDSFARYCDLRDDRQKRFYITKGCTRRWMNMDGDGRGMSGISILWPNPGSTEFQSALRAAERGESPNNISAVIQYRVKDGPTVLWMGDLETDFMERIDDEMDLPQVDILFAPHHGRKSGRVPGPLLDRMDPLLIVVGEAPSDELDYYSGYRTITQNSAGDIVFECQPGGVDIFTSCRYWPGFLENKYRERTGCYYAGSLTLRRSGKRSPQGRCYARLS